MGRNEKLLARLLKKPIDFTYDEAVTLLGIFSYSEVSTGHTSGSRVRFAHAVTKHIIMLHKPHPQSTLKLYQIRELISTLREQGLID